MQIQRIQSVYIFLAIVMLAIFAIVPFGEVVSLEGQAVGTPDPLYVMENPGILIPTGAIILLLLVALFMFRNLRAQQGMMVFTLFLTLSLIAVVCWTLYKEAGAEGMDAHFSWWDILLPVAAFLEILAIGGIKHDAKLLKSLDRIR